MSRVVPLYQKRFGMTPRQTELPGSEMSEQSTYVARLWRVKLGKIWVYLLHEVGALYGFEQPAFNGPITATTLKEIDSITEVVGGWSRGRIWSDRTVPDSRIIERVIEMVGSRYKRWCSEADEWHDLAGFDGFTKALSDRQACSIADAMEEGKPFGHAMVQAVMPARGVSYPWDMDRQKLHYERARMQDVDTPQLRQMNAALQALRGPGDTPKAILMYYVAAHKMTVLGGHYFDNEDKGKAVFSLAYALPDGKVVNGSYSDEGCGFNLRLRWWRNSTGPLGGKVVPE